MNIFSSEWERKCPKCLSDTVYNFHKFNCFHSYLFDKHKHFLKGSLYICQNYVQRVLSRTFYSWKINLVHSGGQTMQWQDLYYTTSNKCFTSLHCIFLLFTTLLWPIVKEKEINKRLTLLLLVGAVQTLLWPASALGSSSSLQDMKLESHYHLSSMIYLHWCTQLYLEATTS